jgi:hypothetical protein
VYDTLGEHGAVFYALVERVSEALPCTMYTFLENDILLAMSPIEANHQYWYEMMERAHLAAATGLLRNRQWLRSVSLELAANNYFGFCAALRGFLEASSDMYYSLKSVPSTLVNQLAEIHCCLSRSPKVTGLFTCKELEDILIHYTHARRPKPGEALPKLHQRLANRNYIDSLQGAKDGPVAVLYGALCEITHPASSSVECFITPGDDPVYIVLAKSLDYWLIRHLCQEHNDAFPVLFELASNPALVILAMINRMPLHDLRVPLFDSIDLSHFPIWNSFLERLRQISESDT